MAIVGKTTANRIEYGNNVLTSAEHHGDEVIDALSSRFEKHSPGSSAHLNPLFQIAAALLREQNTMLLDSEQALTKESADEVKARTGRDDADATTRDHLDKAAVLVSKTLGVAGLRSYGIEEPPPSASAKLELFVSNAVHLFRENPTQIEDPIFGSVSTETLADQLELAAGPLKEANAVIGEEKRERQLALERRDAVAEQWVETYRGVATTLEGLYILAGRRDLADRIRYTVRRASGRTDTGDPPTGAGSDTP